MGETQVTFRNDSARFSLCYPTAIVELPLPKLYKLFGLMLSDYRPDANTQAIATTEAALTDYYETTKAAWHEASLEYQNGYVDTKYGYCTNKKKAEANNKKLLVAVKSTKSKHEKAKKLLERFMELKAKFNR